ncbi:MAG: polyprenyl synthetase family protein [Anaerohalosphaeraceae bacterium]|nr:polyprenyl synthetase family protein [Anaerohalosphaeraceae bacterium]
MVDNKFPLLSQSTISQLVEVASVIKARLEVDDARLKPFLDYVKKRPGKMLRASMLLLSAAGLGEVKQVHIETAAAVEMIHAATLLHDDVIDDAQIRRGAPAANIKWSSETAVLLGDFLLCRAFKICTDLARNDIITILADMADTICIGEMTQNARSGDFTLGLDSYIEIIKKKTAVFFADCCRLGALTAGGDETNVERLADFGLNFGLAFQIADDLTDSLGSEARTGKTAGRDIYKKNLTLPLIHILKSLTSQGRADLIKKLDNGNMPLDELSLLLRSNDSVEYTKSQIAFYAAKALENLEAVKNLSTKKSFAAIANSLVSMEF